MSAHASRRLYFGTDPQYLSDAVKSDTSASRRSGLRSADRQMSNAVLGLSLGSGGSQLGPYSGPAAWNMLPDDLQCCSDTNFLREKLKTFMFQLAFN